MDWIIRYKPMANFQAGLLASLERYIDARGDVLIVSPLASVGHHG
jgi:hypothetical protein